MTEQTPLYMVNNLHYKVTGGHIQDVSPNWPTGVAAFPVGTYHQVFQIEMSQEIPPSHNVIFRRHLDHQHPLIFADDKRKAANDWIATWCDDTFMRYAHLVKFVCDLNEYMGNYDPEWETEHKIAWADAFAYVWANDWRSRPELAHIRAVLARNPVGNDIPVEVARFAQLYDCGLAYHGYWPVRNKVVLPDSAQWYHQRWQHMDASYKAQGITVPFWVSTEIGAVGYSVDNQDKVHLHAADGWKHDDVYNGDIDAFIDSIKAWAQSVAEWNAVNDNRFLGGQIFTTNLPHNNWPYYNVTGDELKIIGDAMSAWQPDITPPPISEDERLFNVADGTQCIAQMPGTALQDRILADGRQLLGNEFNFTRDDGSVWVCRYAGNGQASPRWVYMFPVGDYRPEALVVKVNEGT